MRRKARIQSYAVLFACMHRPPLRSSCCLRAGPAASAPKKIVAPLRYDQQPSVSVRMSRSLFVAVGNVWPTKIGYKTTPYKNSLGIDAKSSEYSSSVIAFYLCSNKRWPQLSHHTVFLSTDWKGSWDSAFGKLPGGELGDRCVGRPERSLVSVRRGHFAASVLMTAALECCCCSVAADCRGACGVSSGAFPPPRSVRYSGRENTRVVSGLCAPGIACRFPCGRGALCEDSRLPPPRHSFAQKRPTASTST